MTRRELNNDVPDHATVSKSKTNTRPMQTSERSAPGSPSARQQPNFRNPTVPNFPAHANKTTSTVVRVDKAPTAFGQLMANCTRDEKMTSTAMTSAWIARQMVQTADPKK